MSEPESEHTSDHISATPSHAPSLKTLFITKTRSPPSCVEFSRHDPNLFVVGTYNLQDADSQSRNGSLELYRVVNSQVRLLQIVEHDSAVLDAHFAPYSMSWLPPSVFAVASSTGKVSLFKIMQDGESNHLACMTTAQLFPESTLVLSLAWHPTFDGIIGVTLSTGHVAILTIDRALSGLKVINESVISHGNFEAWTVAFSASQNHFFPLTIQGIYSGGDDSRLRATEYVISSTIQEGIEEILDADDIQEAKNGFTGHDSGVTAILPLPLETGPQEDVLLTGSYDDTVRVYSVAGFSPSHQNNRGKVLASLHIGGGVWRLKFLRDYSKSSAARSKSDDEKGKKTFRVLASCMHAGVRVLEVGGRPANGEWWIRILASYEGHGSMNYASDVQPIPLLDRKEAREDDSTALCISTSFYDRQLAVWRFEE